MDVFDAEQKNGNGAVAASTAVSAGAADSAPVFAENNKDTACKECRVYTDAEKEQATKAYNDAKTVYEQVEQNL